MTTKSKVNVAVGSVLRELRLEAGMTLVELGRASRPRVDAAQLSRIERGAASTTPETYQGLARALGMPHLGVLFSLAAAKL